MDEDYERNTGKVIVETFSARGIDPGPRPRRPLRQPRPLYLGQGPAQAVYHAVVLEEVARMALLTLTIDPAAAPAPQHVLDKHFHRKHGPRRLLRPEVIRPCAGFPGKNPRRKPAISPLPSRRFSRASRRPDSSRFCRNAAPSAPAEPFRLEQGTAALPPPFRVVPQEYASQPRRSLDFQAL